jgi:hypothetical protein
VVAERAAPAAQFPRVCERFLERGKGNGRREQTRPRGEEEKVRTRGPADLQIGGSGIMHVLIRVIFIYSIYI